MPSRRDTLQHGASLLALLAASGLFPHYAQAMNRNAFDAKSMADALKALGAAAPAESRDVMLTAPDVAENGASVQVTTATSLPGVKQLLILAENNPAALVAVFNVSEQIEPAITTRIKLAQTSLVYSVAVMQNNRTLFAKKEVKVTLGGCG
jgi:sulfur-oxidizing protein SoxY